MAAESRPQRPDPAVRSRPSVSKKRKRRTSSSGPGPTDDQRPPPAKQRRTTGTNVRTLQSADAVKHALLAQYYPTTLTLRQYVLSHLPASSRIRRRKVAAVGTADGSEDDPSGVRAQLATLLDTTLVGLAEVPRETAKEQSEDRLQQWIEYSQRDDSHVTLSGGDASATHLQSEIIDFIIWLLFSREKNPSRTPHHLLCDGLRRRSGPRQQGVPSSIQGLHRVFFNERVAAIKQVPWPQLLQILGKSGESMMINLLLDCSVFLPVEAGRGNYYQLSGAPIFECDPLSSPLTSPGPVKDPSTFERKPTDVIFVRSRIFYARAALNARGLVHFGFKHIHALNRFPLHCGDRGGSTQPAEDGDGNNVESLQNGATLRIMIYMFPRQFGLHNAFTSHVDHLKSAQKFQDYTLREAEIFAKFGKTDGNGSRQLDVRVPKRLRGRLEHMIQRLQTRHARCSYSKLLEHYCPSDSSVPGDGRSHYHHEKNSATAASLSSGKKPCGRHSKTRKRLGPAPLHTPNPPKRSYSSLIELAVPVSKISGFCQAVLSKIIPDEFWGCGEVQSHNQRIFLRNVDRFIKLRRFESISLHEVMQGLKVTEIQWLEPPGLQGQKCSQTDFRKRREIFAEFVYYVFDSLLIPLVRGNFYVTESNVHRYRLFFFRHDVWRSIAEPAMAQLRAKMFEEVKAKEASAILDSRRLGYSQIRLLPKNTSVRPIVNLRRRMITSKDRQVLGQSINSILGPVYSMLKLEKSHHGSRLGSTMFSVGDLYERLSSFKQRLGLRHGPLYFAKVDVQSAFDTIPQDAVVALMNSVPSQDVYEMIKHVEVALNSSDLGGSKVIRRWYSTAKAAGDRTTFLEMLTQQRIPSKKNTVHVDTIFRKIHGTRDLLALLASHVQQNLVKMGKKYYRQKNGIPQGSVLSSVLCNYFYADLERTHLGFVRADNGSLLLRLIDDFLLITTDQAKASRFVTVMQAGIPEYGVTISPPKTLVNFALSVNGLAVPAIQPGSEAVFPYCGTQINTHTLELTRDRGLAPIHVSAVKDPAVTNALTVEFTRHPGANFKRKTLSAFKLQSHLMFYDARHNTTHTVLRNLSDALVETAAKAWAYVRCLPLARQPGVAVWVDTINELVDVVYHLLTSGSRRVKYPWYECRIGKGQVRALTLRAFRWVLRRKQARFLAVLTWLDEEMASMEERKGKKEKKKKKEQSGGEGGGGGGGGGGPDTLGEK